MHSIPILEPEELREIFKESLQEFKEELMKDFKTNYIDKISVGEYCTITQACDLLKISRQTFDKMRKRYNTDTYRVGNSKRYKTSEILTYIKKASYSKRS